MIDVTLVSRRQLNDALFSFDFRPIRPVRYIPGQFIELTVPHDNSDSRGIKRWFTLFSSPTDDLLSITTRITKQPSSYKATLASLEPGTQLQMASPMGDFILPKDESIPLVFVAGGIGITPFHSIVSWLHATHQTRDIQLLHAIADETDDIFSDIKSALGDHYHISTKRLSADDIVSLTTDRHYIYLSGPEPMVESLNDQLLAHKINKNHIHTDFFSGYTQI